MSDKCDICRAPVWRAGDRVQFDSSQYHMDAVKKLSRISALMGEVEYLEQAMRDIQAATSDKAVLKITDDALFN